MDGTGHLFEPFIAALGGEFQVKVVRYPAAEPLGYAELEGIARAALPLEGPYVLLGESFSGPIAIALAASAPDRLLGLILCCTFVRNPRPAFAGVQPLVDFLPTTWAPIHLLSHFLLGAFSTAKLRAMLQKALAEVSPAVFRTRLKAVLSTDVSSQLRAVSVPTLYLRASEDRLVPPSASELIAQLAPSMRVTQIHGPHCLLQAAPVDAAQAVRGFVRELQASAPRQG
jgi:pimeloyl-[acyl-carrier protein] methyl ester esterase